MRRTCTGRSYPRYRRWSHLVSSSGIAPAMGRHGSNNRGQYVDLHTCYCSSVVLPISRRRRGRRRRFVET
eukprot:scaffold426_cov219-Amphora_coffeaeformis.AAC.14